MVYYQIVQRLGGNIVSRYRYDRYVNLGDAISVAKDTENALRVEEVVTSVVWRAGNDHRL